MKEQEPKGYLFGSGYIGFVENLYNGRPNRNRMQFETDVAYLEYLEYTKENENEAKKKENEY